MASRRFASCGAEKRGTFGLFKKRKRKKLGIKRKSDDGVQGHSPARPAEKQGGIRFEKGVNGGRGFVQKSSLGVVSAAIGVLQFSGR